MNPLFVFGIFIHPSEDYHSLGSRAAVASGGVSATLINLKTSQGLQEVVYHAHLACSVMEEPVDPYLEHAIDHDKRQDR